MVAWTAADIEIVLEDEFSAGAVVTARIRLPVGEIEVMAEIERFDRELVLEGVHIQGQNLGPNRLGWARLQQIARAVAEKADVDTIVVKGATRTSGALPGRTIPGPIRFTRPLPAPR
jgi:nucleotide-binding universal stress UspA family protein